MEKHSFAILCMAGFTLMASCGVGNGKGSESTDGSSISIVEGLKDGTWPAAIYDKYGIDEMHTQGKITFTNFQGEGSYQHEVYYKGVTRDEVLAYVKGLKAKGFRLTARNQEILEKSGSEEVFLYQKGEGKDMCLRLYFNFRNNDTMDYYADEVNPAYEVQEKGESYFIEYNFRISLNPIENQPIAEGSIASLGVSAADLQGLPGVRIVELKEGTNGGSIRMAFFRDHEVTDADLTALHRKVAEVLEAKGVKMSHVFSGNNLSAEQLKSDGIRSYMVEKDGKKFLLMPHSDTRAGDFGGGVSFNFTLSRN